MPSSHTGNQSRSIEEADTVAALVGSFVGGSYTWTTRDGLTRPIGPGNVLVVAPYNAQVYAIQERVPAGVQVGTVDRFQGREAPIVIYSMTTSSPEDAPRGMEFLYSPNRLNVATSRAMCVVVLVGSPALFEPSCQTPRQMRLANAFARYAELAVRV